MNTLPEASFGSASIELAALDLRYEGCRMKQAVREEKLLGAIAERGIEEALEGVDVGGKPILLNGFKRYRCARKLRLAAVPYVTLGSDAATGIIAMLRASNRRALSILEQAAFLDELKRSCNCSLAQIAGDLERSKGWVSMRLGLLAQMSDAVRRKLFAGVFPVYSYMYTLRPFMRMNGGAEQVERFIGAVSGHGLSVRDIELLAQGYFRGPEAVRRHIEEGRVPAVLEELRPVPAGAREGCSPFEAALLHELEAVQKYLVRVTGRSEDQRLQSGPFHAQAHLLAAGILAREPAFVAAVRRLHDRGRPA